MELLVGTERLENVFHSIFMAYVRYYSCEARSHSHDRRHSALPLPAVKRAGRAPRTFGPRPHSCGREKLPLRGQAPTSEKSALSPYCLERSQGRSNQRTYL